MHYYQKNIADYRKDTCHLTLLEHGIYNMLMDSYYLNEEPIKTQTVNRRLSINSEEEEEALLGVLNDFFVLDNETDLWSHSRIDVEINKYHLKAEVNKKNGKLGGRPKKTQSVISGLPEESEGKAKITLTSNHKPITNNQEPIKSLCPQTDGNKRLLSALWERSPEKARRRSSKKQVMDAWKKIKQADRPTEEDLIKAIAAWKDCEDWKKDNGEYIKGLHLWIKNQQWDSLPEKDTAPKTQTSETSQKQKIRYMQ